MIGKRSENMEKIIHKTKSFDDADQWDIQQNASLSLEERLQAAQELKKRVYGGNCPDVRETKLCVKKRR
jgi:hypothetical protein